MTIILELKINEKLYYHNRTLEHFYTKKVYTNKKNI